jgi:hypothetical protein
MEVVWVAMRDSVAALRFGEDDVTADEQPIAEGLGHCHTGSVKQRAIVRPHVFLARSEFVPM